MKFRGNYVFLNERLLDRNKAHEHFLALEEKNSIYEVLRIVQGVPLFAEAHFSRFQQALEKLQIQFDTSIDWWIEKAKTLCAKNHIEEGNMRFELFPGNNSKLIVFFIPHSYPRPEQYQMGVHLGSYYIERPDPNIKQSEINRQVRTKIAEQLNNPDLYEIVLVNHDGNITECSRSNLFFVKGNKLYTAPHTKVLMGITRQKVFELCKELKIDIVEQEISLKDIHKFDAAFLTGTSPKILPIAAINSVVFQAENTIISTLMNGYNILIDRYIQNF